MSKRKREIKKRKKLLEETPAEENLLAREPAEDVEEREDPSSGASEPEETLPSESESTLDDNQIVSAPAPPPARRHDPKKEARVKQPKLSAGDSWFGQNKENFLLGLLILYVLLLGLGTVGELFEIEWILNLPLFR